ncbi:MAG: hypothetical protein ACKO0M_08375, partial [Cyanobium sp.]
MKRLVPFLTPRRAGLVVALLQGGLLLSLGGVMLSDRLRLPRAWVRTVPVDPELPIRGRYVSLRLLVPAPQLASALPAGSDSARPRRHQPSSSGAPKAVLQPSRARPTGRPLPSRV